MKIKNSVQSISPDISIVLMCLALLVACPVRIFQMLKNIDSVTGFYTDFNSIMIYVLYGVLGVAALLILVLTFLSGRIPAAVPPNGRRIPLAAASFVLAATLFYDAISTYFFQKEATATIVQNVKSASTLSHVHALCALLASCYFVVFFISYLSGNDYYKKLKILSLTPVLWAIIKVLERITVIISIVRVSELLLELFAFVFLMVFFMAFARVASDVSSTGSMWSVISCGCIAALFILTYSIPRLMLTVTGNAESLVNGYPLVFADIGCVLFILVFVVTTLRKGYTVEDVEKMNAEIAMKQEQDEKIQENVSNVKALTEEGAASDTINVKIAKVSAPEAVEEEENQE